MLIFFFSSLKFIKISRADLIYLLVLFHSPYQGEKVPDNHVNFNRDNIDDGDDDGKD